MKKPYKVQRAYTNTLSLDFDEGQELYERMSDDSLTPDQAWDRQWADSVIRLLHGVSEKKKWYPEQESNLFL